MAAINPPQRRIFFLFHIPRVLLSQAGWQWPSPCPRRWWEPGTGDGQGHGSDSYPGQHRVRVLLCASKSLFSQVPSSKRLILGLMLFFSHVPPGSLGLATVRGNRDTLQGTSTPASTLSPQQVPKARGLFPGLSCSPLLLGHRRPWPCQDRRPPWPGGMLRRPGRG